MPQLGGLVGQRCDKMRMRVTERIHRDAAAEIEDAATIGRDQPGAIASLEGEVSASVDRQNGGRCGTGTRGRQGRPLSKKKSAAQTRRHGTSLLPAHAMSNQPEY